jgi:hypothetical protein
MQITNLTSSVTHDDNGATTSTTSEGDVLIVLITVHYLVVHHPI